MEKSEKINSVNSSPNHKRTQEEYGEAPRKVKKIFPIFDISNILEIPRKEYSPNISNNYQNRRYYMEISGKVIKKHVGEEHFELFLQDMTLSKIVNPSKLNPTKFIAISDSTEDAGSNETNCSESEVDAIVTQNVRKLFQSLPPKSHFRKELIRVLTTNLSVAVAANLCSTSKSTIVKGQSLNIQSLELTTTKYA
jgi:hypothetical protein